MNRDMNVRSAILGSLLYAASATAGAAATYNIGNVTSAFAATETLTVQTLDFVEFTLDAPNGSFLSALDITVTSMAGSNFRPIIGLYANDTLIASNHSNLSGGTATLSFGDTIGPVGAAYTLGIGAWRSFFTTDIANARSTAYFNNGDYDISITPTISPVPLPAGGLLLLTGILALAFRRRGSSD